MNKKMSFSQLETFILCPYKWYLTYVKKIKSEGNQFTLFGIAFHDLAEDVYKKEIFEAKYYIGKWKSILGKEYKNGKYKSVKSGDLRWQLSRGYPAIHKFFKAAKEYNLLNSAIATEKKMTGKFHGYKITGIVDLIHTLGGKLTIIDYKTGKPKDSHIKQLTLYKELANINREKKIEQCAIWYIFSGKIVVIKEDRKGTANYMNDTIKEIESCLSKNKFKKCTNKYCSSCVGMTEGFCK